MITTRRGERHALSGDEAEKIDAYYNGSRLDDEPTGSADQPVTSGARQIMPVLGRCLPQREPWRQELIDLLYADSGVP